MVARSILITGANRGLGLELVKQLLAAPDAPQVLFATCRDPSQATDLKAVVAGAKGTKVHILKLDVDKEDQIAAVAAAVGKELDSEGLTLLINNSGILEKDHLTFADQTKDEMVAHFVTNTVAPYLLTRALHPLLKKAAEKNPTAVGVKKAAVINMSTRMGSIGDNTSGGFYAYRASKAALNIVSKSMSVDLGKEGILVVPIHPGWVKTRMGGPQGLIDEETSVSGMLKVIRGLTNKDVNSFYDYKGDTVPW